MDFWTTPVGWTLLTVGQILLITVPLLLVVAFVIYGDRKIFAAVQMRKGPNVVGPFGLLQSFADLGKFLIKELVVPAGADKFVFLLAPMISVTLALGSWAAMPLAPGWVVSNINVGSVAKPVGTVFIALASAAPTVVLRQINPFDRETFKYVTSQQALNLLRRTLLGL